MAGDVPRCPECGLYIYGVPLSQHDCRSYLDWSGDPYSMLNSNDREIESLRVQLETSERAKQMLATQNDGYNQTISDLHSQLTEAKDNRCPP